MFQLAAYQSRAAKSEDGGETTDQLRARWRAGSRRRRRPARAAGTAGVRAGDGDHKREATLSRLGLRPSMELALVEVIDRLERQPLHLGPGPGDRSLVASCSRPHKASSAEKVRPGAGGTADQVLAHADVVRLTCPDRPDVRHGGLRYSTWWTLKTEQAVL